MNKIILSFEKHQGIQSEQAQTSRIPITLGTQIVREIVIPELTKEVNENKNFSQLRQVYNSLILATWYKKKIKDSILAQVYADKNKVAGVNIDDPQEKEKIYQRYLKAFKKGVYNYIKEDIDPITQETIPRKYFSGGEALFGIGKKLDVEDDQRDIDNLQPEDDLVVKARINGVGENLDQAMSNAEKLENEVIDHPQYFETIYSDPEFNRISLEVSGNDQALAKRFQVETAKFIEAISPSKGYILGETREEPADGLSMSNYGRVILLNKLSEYGIDPKYVLMFRFTDPRDGEYRKPEAWWGASVFDVGKILKKERNQKNNDLLVTNLDKLIEANPEGSQAQDDFDGAVRLIGNRPFSNESLLLNPIPITRKNISEDEARRLGLEHDSPSYYINRIHYSNIISSSGYNFAQLAEGVLNQAMMAEDNLFLKLPDDLVAKLRQFGIQDATSLIKVLNISTDQIAGLPRDEALKLMEPSEQGAAYDAFDESGENQNVMISYVSHFQKALELVSSHILNSTHPGANVLSIGEGQGHLASYLMKLGLKVKAVDISDNNVALAKAKGVDEIKGDANHLPDEIKDNSFDVVVFSESIGGILLDEPFKEALRVLKPGGKIIITTYPAEEIPDRESITKETKYLYYSVEEVQEALQQAGFDSLYHAAIPANLVPDFKAAMNLKTCLIT